MDPSRLVPIVVPLALFSLAAFVVAAALYAGHRARELRHQTIRLALEKGQPLPPELLVAPPRRGSDLSLGVKLVALGAGLCVALFLIHRHVWPAGLVLVALGIGYLVSHALAAPRPEAPGPGGR